ncbi:unnamed protein product [Arctia plantaginis]|uniref:Uncharacterized protein n=1 Tax=Arctia plantaginis TaxID=874455 RepID=A0A8S1AD03_ARCPL|nr:unnamed protein product [Arctia plantaginis]
MLVECKSSAEEGCTNDSENTDSETSDSERLDTQKENLDSTYVEGTTLGSTTSDEDFSNATSDPDITLEVPGTSDTQSKREPRVGSKERREVRDHCVGGMLARRLAQHVVIRDPNAQSQEKSDE